MRPEPQERGVALIFVLLMMSIVMAVAVVAARLTTLSERAARNDRDRQIAFQAAEAALNDAELDIIDPTTTRGCQFGTAAIVAGSGCSSDSAMRGVCGLDAGNPDTPIYKVVNWDSTGSDQQYVTYGDFTGRSSSFQIGQAGLPAALPKYIILKTATEARLVYDGGKRVVTTPHAYKVYALGYGASVETQVLLESVVIKPVLSLLCAS